jgi:hypothetical protein
VARNRCQVLYRKKSTWHLSFLPAHDFTIPRADGSTSSLGLPLSKAQLEVSGLLKQAKTNPLYDQQALEKVLADEFNFFVLAVKGAREIFRKKNKEVGVRR